MKIAIIGGGISGLAAYLALKKRLPSPPKPETDHKITIYEAHETSTRPANAPPAEGPAESDTYSATLSVGGGLGLGPNGLAVLRNLDEEVFHDVVRAGYPYSRAAFLSARGFQMMKAPMRNDETPSMNSLMISRNEFWNSLRRRVPDRVIVNRKIAEVVTVPGGKGVLRFADGTADVEADLVLGADGLKSIARRSIFPAEDGGDAYPPHYEGFVGVGGFIPTADLPEEVEASTMSFVFGRNGFFGYGHGNSSPSDPSRHLPYGNVQPGDSLMWWSTYFVDDCPDPKTIDKQDVTRQLRERHGDWNNAIVQKIVNTVTLETMWPVWTVPSLPRWWKDSVVLLGDAAHTLPPTSGQGSAQALEDVESFSLLLSHYLERQYRSSVAGQESEAISQAAAKHMELRQPRVQAILDRARMMDSKKRDLGIIAEGFLCLFFMAKGLLFPQDATEKWVINYNIAEEVHKAIASETEEE